MASAPRPDEKRRYEIYLVTRGNRNHGHVLEVWTQPRFRYILSVIYRWYILRLASIPGARRLIDRVKPSASDGSFYMTISDRQSLRAYRLANKHRVFVDKLTLTEQQYTNITGESCELVIEAAE